MSIHNSMAAWVAALLAGSVVAPQPATADAVADFYRGKTITMLVGVSVGGEFDLAARLMAKYLARHLPGRPTAVTQNLTGASGLKMANYLYLQAPRDGAHLGLLQPFLPAAQSIGLNGIQFDAARFRWLGTIAPVIETMVLWHAARAKSIAEARAGEVVIGATAKGSNTYTLPALMNEFFGTRFKIVTGYNGGTQINLAMERGEVAGRNNSWSSWKVTKPDWIRDRKITVIAQAGPRSRDLEAPSVEDLAQTADQRQIVELLTAGEQLGRPFVMPPGIPEERVSALRAAFEAAMADPDFLAEANALNFDVDPVGGSKLESVVAKVLATPRDLAARARHLLE
jgi:tripartite-type tricarboxylate transporter receptor subunit TctC